MSEKQIYFDEQDKGTLINVLESACKLATDEDLLHDIGYIRWWAERNGLISESESEKIFATCCGADKRLRDAIKKQKQEDIGEICALIEHYAAKEYLKSEEACQMVEWLDATGLNPFQQPEFISMLAHGLKKLGQQPHVVEHKFVNKELFEEVTKREGLNDD